MSCSSINATKKTHLVYSPSITNKKAIQENLKTIYKHLPSTRLKLAIADIDKGNITPFFSIENLGKTNLENLYTHLTESFYFDNEIKKLAKSKEQFRDLDIAFSQLIKLSAYIKENIDAWMDTNLSIFWNDHLRPLLEDQNQESKEAKQIRELIQKNKNHLNKIKYLDLMGSKMTIIPKEVNELENLEQVIADHSDIASFPRVFDGHRNEIKVYFN
ncbi:hypothetical protein [Candidatus Neptunochlamydia vexilliferae]|uniref:Uncharacterized protein n=1 Tax=Candidatus Neptunichlamydia vexilliferae TaxID=1651774 RepID=A0ABS0AWV6_9BACT|nr:hypothetical protein [Candidatus Neptunochlamydia vexilliferae]MBF5058622.1 hypothetical protein [Candidatus Neptunochlamydia vexilliferae]